MRTIVYSFVCADLPHWGHVLHLKKARELGDILIVGVLDDDTIETYKRRPIMPLEERMKMMSQIKGVDLVIPQLLKKYPLENLKVLHKLFPNDKILCVHADDWERGEFTAEIEFLESIGGELRLLPYYHGASSTTKIIEKMKERIQRGEI